MALTLITAPATEPLTLADAKLHLRVDVTADDGLIVGLIAAARERVEAVTGRQLIQATWDLLLDRFPCEYEIRLPKPPLVSVTYLKYIDTAGVTQTWSSANYQVDAPAGPYAASGRVAPAYATNWPAGRSDTYSAVMLRFIAGYGTNAAAVPQAIRQAMLLMIGAWYEHRDDLIGRTDDHAPLGALALVTPYKVYA